MKLAAFAAMAMLVATPLAAEEITATSQITSVTVFSRGAEVRRALRLKITGGEHVVVLKDVPAKAIASSIRVEGRSTGRLEIGAVDTRRLKIPRTDPSISQTERQRLETEIERATDVRDLIQSEINAASAQKALIEKLATLPERPASTGAGSDKSAPVADWSALFALIGTKMLEAEKAALAAHVKLRDADRKVADLKTRLTALAPQTDERTEVRVHLTAAAPLEADLTVSYQVSDASWSSLYDARLMTGARNAPPRLTITRRAAVRQSTGEDWRDVALTLSTTRPGTGVSAPELRPLLVDFLPERLSGAVNESARAARSEQERTRQPAAPASEAKKVSTEERTAQTEAGEFQATFTIAGKHTIGTSGESKRLAIDTAQIEPSLVIRAVPRLQPHAYLYARVTMPRTATYLAGPVALFRDGTFVGTGALPHLAAGETHELGFGIDDAVRVKHAILDEKRGETGLITASKTDTRNYRITIKNLHERAVAMVVQDHIPASRQQDIKVELTGRTPPTRRDIDERRGVLAWESKLEPDEERQIEFGYRVTWPGAKRIIYGR